EESDAGDGDDADEKPADTSKQAADDDKQTADSEEASTQGDGRDDEGSQESSEDGEDGKDKQDKDDSKQGSDSKAAENKVSGSHRGPDAPPVKPGELRTPGEAPYASPAVRAFARELGVDITQVEG